MKPIATRTDLESHEFRVLGALFTGRSGHSFLRRTDSIDGFGLLRISSTHLTLGSWFLPRYEFPKSVIERLICRERRILKGLQFTQLRTIHKLPDAPQYILFVTCNPAELKAPLTACDFDISEARRAAVTQ